MARATHPADGGPGPAGAPAAAVDPPASSWPGRHPTAVPWLYLGAIAIAEVETSLLSLPIGLAMHCLVLVMLPFHAAWARGKPYQPMLLCLVVLPLLRIVSLTLPLIYFPVSAWYLLVSIPVFVCTCMVANVLGYGRRDLGLVWRRGWAQLAILLCGPFLGWIEGHILTVQGLVAPATVTAMVPPALILLCSGFMEELVYRGLLQRAAFGLFADDGILFSCLLFAIMQTGYRSVPDSIFAFSVGLLFATVARRTGSIIGVSASHGLASVTLSIFLPLFSPSA